MSSKDKCIILAKLVNSHWRSMTTQLSQNSKYATVPNVWKNIKEAFTSSSSAIDAFSKAILLYSSNGIYFVLLLRNCCNSSSRIIQVIGSSLGSTLLVIYSTFSRMFLASVSSVLQLPAVVLSTGKIKPFLAHRTCLQFLSFVMQLNFSLTICNISKLFSILSRCVPTKPMYDFFGAEIHCEKYSFVDMTESVFKHIKSCNISKYV